MVPKCTSHESDIILYETKHDPLTFKGDLEWSEMPPMLVKYTSPFKTLFLAVGKRRSVSTRWVGCDDVFGLVQPGID